MTSTMSTWRSNQLSYNPISLLDTDCLTTFDILTQLFVKSKAFFEKN